MALTRGNYPGQQIPPGFDDEQEREIQKELILLQMRRYLRFFWIGITIYNLIRCLLVGRGFWAILDVTFSGVLGYGITVWLFVYVLANWVIKIYLYLKSLFGGEARL